MSGVPTRRRLSVPELGGDVSFVALIRRAIRAWRTRSRLSREAIAARIISAYEAMGLDRVTGIGFDLPVAKNPARRLKLNTERIFRWLDDDSKDDDILPLNCLPAVLAALPLDLRVQLADALLHDAGLRVEVLGEEDELVSLRRLVCRVARESARATDEMSKVVDTAATMTPALRALGRCIVAMQDAVASMEALSVDERAVEEEVRRS